MLVTNYLVWKNHQLNDSVTNILKLSPLLSHQHKVVTNINVASNTSANEKLSLKTSLVHSATQSESFWIFSQNLHGETVDKKLFWNLTNININSISSKSRCDIMFATRYWRIPNSMKHQKKIWNNKNRINNDE